MGNDMDQDQFSPEELAEARRYALVIEWSDENAAYEIEIHERGMEQGRIYECSRILSAASKYP